MAKPKDKPNPFRSFLVETEAEPADAQAAEPQADVLVQQAMPPPISQPASTELQIPPRKRGRQTGKRSNPDYIQVGAYIPKTVDRDVKRKLLDEDMDFSDLVTKLLQDWLIG